MRTRLPVSTALLVAAGLVARPSGAGEAGGGALDVELPNRVALRGSLDAREELDTLRLRVPERAALRLAVTGKGRVVPDIRLFAPGGDEIALGPALRVRGRTAKLAPLTTATPGLYRIDVRARGGATGTYRMGASWTLPKRTRFDATLTGGGGTLAFDAEAGAAVKATLRAATAGASVHAVRLEGPEGYDVPLETPAARKSAARLGPLPRTGRYRLTLATSPASAVEVTAILTQRAPATRASLDLRSAERRGTGVARTVTRRLAEAGGDLAVPALDSAQRVQIDASGLAVVVPAGALTEPAALSMRTDDDVIADPLGFAPAGVLVQFDVGGRKFETPVAVTLPFDVGAFPGGDPRTDACVLRRADDGQVTEVPPSGYDVDVDAGTVTFPASGFSSFQVFAPPTELVEVARPGRPNDIAVAPDEDVAYVSTDLLSNDDPAAAVLRYTPGGALTRFAGGGGATGDGIHRLAYDFDRDRGFEGVVIGAVAAGRGGEIVVVTGDRARGASVAYLVRADGSVLRIAGDGGADLDESRPARATGLPFCDAAALLPNGDVLLVTDAYRYPLSDRVLRVYTGFADIERIRVETVAGGGTVDVDGADPLATRLLQPRALLVDAAGRVLVGDRDWLVRFDLVRRTTTTLAGTNFGEREEDGGDGRTLGGVGAPLRTVVLGALDDLAFAPGGEELVYAADPESGIVWRLDLVRDRAYIAAGRSVDFDRTLTTRTPDPGAVDPNEPLDFPVAVAPLGDEVLIAELFDFRLFALRRAP